MSYSVMSIFERLKITVCNNRDTGNGILTRNYVFYQNFVLVHFMLSTMNTLWIMVMEHDIKEAKNFLRLRS